MYLSFTSMPGVKQLSLRERVALLRKVDKSAKTGRRYFLVMVASLVGTLVVGGVLQGAGLQGDALGYPMLISMLGIWLAGYLYVLNKHVYPKVLEMTVRTCLP